MTKSLICQGFVTDTIGVTRKVSLHLRSHRPTTHQYHTQQTMMVGVTSLAQLQILTTMLVTMWQDAAGCIECGCTTSNLATCPPLHSNCECILIYSDPGADATIPSRLGSLTRLRGIEIISGNLVGTLPPSLGSLTNLDQGLEFYGNLLTGTFACSYKKCVQCICVAL